LEVLVQNSFSVENTRNWNFTRTQMKIFNSRNFCGFFRFFIFDKKKLCRFYIENQVFFCIKIVNFERKRNSPKIEYHSKSQEFQKSAKNMKK